MCYHFRSSRHFLNVDVAEWDLPNRVFAYFWWYTMLCWVQILSIINACKSELNHIKKVLRISGWGILVLPAMAYRSQRLYSIRCDISALARNHNFSSRTSLSGTNLYSAILGWLDHQHVTAHWSPALHMLDAGHQNYKITISKHFAPQVLEACWLVCGPSIYPEGATSGWA